MGNVVKIMNQCIDEYFNYKYAGFLSIIIVDENEMTKMNKIHRNKDYATDVLAFGHASSNKFIREELGDVFICYETLMKNAKIIGNTILEEFLFLCVHGILHLFGYDHQDKITDQEMRWVQRNIFNRTKTKLSELDRNWINKLQ